PTENEPDHPDRRDLPQPPRRRSRLCRGRAWRDEPCQGLASCTLSRAEHTLAFVRCEPDHVTSPTSASIPSYDASRCGQVATVTAVIESIARGGRKLRLDA